MRRARGLIAALIVGLATAWSQAAQAAPFTATRAVLDNGLVLLCAQRTEIPMVVVKVLVKAGSAQDRGGKEGAANLTAVLLTRGTARHDALALAEEIDRLGASLDAAVSDDYTTVTLTTLRKNLKATFALLAEAVVSPTLPAPELDKKRAEVLGYLETQQESPGWLAQKAFLETLYPHHPYGRQVEGSRESLSGLTRDDVATFHETYYRPNNAVVAFVGDVSEKEARDLVETKLGGWPAAAIPETPWPEFVPPRNSAPVTLNKEVTQANVILGHQGIARDNPDYYAVRVMNYLLGGGGFESLLMKRIREEMGLVYHVESSFSARKQPGPFSITLQTRNASARRALDEALTLVGTFLEQGVTEEDLARAKAFFIEGFPLTLVSNRHLAELLPALEFYGLGLDYVDRYPRLIEQVTLEKVREVARKYIRPADLIKVVVADLKKANLSSN